MKTTAQIKEMYKKWKIYTYSGDIPSFYVKWNLLNEGYAFSIEWNTDLNCACFHTNGDNEFNTDPEFAAMIKDLD